MMLIRAIESFPDLCQIGKVRQEYGNHCVGSNPGNGQYENPEVVEQALPASVLLRKTQILPDQVTWFWGQSNGCALWMLVSCSVGD